MQTSDKMTEAKPESGDKAAADRTTQSVTRAEVPDARTDLQSRLQEGRKNTSEGGEKAGEGKSRAVQQAGAAPAPNNDFKAKIAAIRQQNEEAERARANKLKGPTR